MRPCLFACLLLVCLSLASYLVARAVVKREYTADTIELIDACRAVLEDSEKACGCRP